MNDNSTSWRWQQETSINPNGFQGGHTEETRFEVYTSTGPYKHVATCYTEGDARLTAAAPRMLALLRELSMASTFSYDAPSPLHGLAEEADKIITDVEGGAP